MCLKRHPTTSYLIFPASFWYPLGVFFSVSSYVPSGAQCTPAAAYPSTMGSVASGLAQDGVQAAHRGIRFVPAYHSRLMSLGQKHRHSPNPVPFPETRLYSSVSVGLRYSPLPYRLGFRFELIRLLSRHSSVWEASDRGLQ